MQEKSVFIKHVYLKGGASMKLTSPFTVSFNLVKFIGVLIIGTTFVGCQGKENEKSQSESPLANVDGSNCRLVNGMTVCDRGPTLGSPPPEPATIYERNCYSMSAELNAPSTCDVKFKGWVLLPGNVQTNGNVQAICRYDGPGVLIEQVFLQGNPELNWRCPANTLELQQQARALPNHG